MIIYLSLFIQNTLGYSPVQAGLRFLPLSLASFTAALITGRLIGKVPMRMLLGVAMVAAAAGLASMAHLTATSTWLVLLPGYILAGIGLGITSTALAPAALAAVEPARAGMAAGLVNFECSRPATAPSTTSAKSTATASFAFSAKAPSWHWSHCRRPSAARSTAPPATARAARFRSTATAPAWTATPRPDDYGASRRRPGFGCPECTHTCCATPT
jgi:MFS family permease